MTVLVPQQTQDLLPQAEAAIQHVALEPGLTCIFLPLSVPVLGRVRIEADPDTTHLVASPHEGWMTSPGDAVVARCASTGRVRLTTYRQGASSIRLEMRRLDAYAAKTEAIVLAVATDPTPPGAPASPAYAISTGVSFSINLPPAPASLGKTVGVPGAVLLGFSLPAPIEGAVSAHDTASAHLEYQGVLGTSWVTPWIPSGELCGTRLVTLPLLGVRMRLTPDAPAHLTCKLDATFGPGHHVGPVEGREVEAISRAEGLTQFLIEVLVTRR